MNSYQLDDKCMDEAFLKGEVVVCGAVIKAGDYNAQKIKPGDAIVVLLSTRAKYSGKVVNFIPDETRGNYILGKLEILRSSAR